MRLSFKEFSERPQLNEFITHLEDLPLEKFTSAVENLSRYRANEKMDGANLVVGFDGKGKLYTSREPKGGKKYYFETDYPDISAYDPFVAAHRVLQKNEDVLRAGLGHGSAVLEVLYGAQPNTVAYGKDGHNYIVFLRLLNAAGNPVEDQTPIDQVMKLLGDSVTSVSTKGSETADGTLLTRAPSVTNWKFAKAQEVPARKLNKANFSDQLAVLRSFLQAPNEAGTAIMQKPMTNSEVLSTKKRELTLEKDEVVRKVQEFKLGVKDELVDLLVKGLKPSLSDENTEGYKGIEGVVFFDPKTGEEFKVVDKKTFGAVNKFNYDVRNKVYSKNRSDDPDKPLESRGGLFGDSITRIHRLFGIQGLDTPITTKKTLEKFKGATADETVDNMLNSLVQLSFGATKKKTEAILTNLRNELEDLLENFKKNADRYTLELPDGIRVKYTKEVKRRTLLTFAETLRRVENMMADVNEARTLKRLIRIIFGDKINRLHTPEEEEE